MFSFTMWRNGISRRLAYLRSSGKSGYLTAKFSRWLKRTQEHASKHDNLLRTEMFVQEGYDIYELPIVIKKTHDIQSIFEHKNIDNLSANVSISNTENFKKNTSQEDSGTFSENKQKIDSDANSTSILLASDLDILKNFNVEQVFKDIGSTAYEEKINRQLESVVHTEINSRIALQCLKKIIDSERKHRKLLRASKFIVNRHMLVRQLTEIIVSSQDNEMILEVLSVMLKDKFVSPNNSYKDIITNEALIRSTNGDFSIQQLIDITKILSTFRDSKYQDAVDYFWTGFVIKQEDITADHLVPLFKLLVYMKKSRSRIQILLEKKLIKNYHKLSAPQMTEIINVFQNSLQSPVVFKCASKWANMHLLSISKYDLLEFVESLTAVVYVNSTLEKAIERTIMAKQIKSNDHALMAAVANYCSTVHLRNVCICDRIVKYLEKHGKSLPLDSLVEMIVALGELNYEPQSKEDFWSTFEQILDQQFFYLQQDKIMHILLSCAYINKYFPKCMEKIFSSEFLDKLNLQSNVNTAQLLRGQLYLLDTAMTLECATYSGPLLFRSQQLDPAAIDVRISRILNKIHSQLVKLAGDKDKLSRHVTLSNLSTTGLYTIDALIHKEPKSKPVLELDLVKEKNVNTAVIILLPDFYCWNSYKLTGEQAMKVRHLRKLGFRVMLLDFQTLCLLTEKVDELAKYLNHTFRKAHDAL